jgi:hypothetical protein
MQKHTKTCVFWFSASLGTPGLPRAAQVTPKRPKRPQRYPKGSPRRPPRDAKGTHSARKEARGHTQGTPKGPTGTPKDTKGPRRPATCTSDLHLQLPLLSACLAFSSRLFRAFTFLRLSCLLLRHLLLPAPPPASSASCLSCHQFRYLPPPLPDCAPTSCTSNLYLHQPLLICSGSSPFFATVFLSRPGTVTADTCNGLCPTCFFAVSSLQLPPASPTSTCNCNCSSILQLPLLI